MEAYDQQEIKAVVDCLNDGWLAPGPRTAEFERRLAERFGKKYGLFVNSGSSANMLAVICSGIGPGVEVITPACTFSTTVAPLAQHGANVKFCDVAPQCYVPSVDQVFAELTENTKVIMIPNLLGNKIDWKDLKEKLVQRGRNDIILIEDSCDTITYTAETDISTCSFYASHIITAGGTGGVVMFNDIDMYNKALRIRDWGRAGNNDESIAERFNHGILGDIQYDWKFLYVEFGYNFKACEMNAAFGLVQLDKLKKFEDMRKERYNRYIKNLTSDPYASKYYKFPIVKDDILLLALPLECPHRMEVLTYLENNQIQTRVTMAGNILRHPIYTKHFAEQAARSFPEADEVMKTGFLVGCHHGLTLEDVDRVSKVLCDFAKEHLGK
ncbi:DegT/DnrJ/EryC1/StrS aminotransferase family protein [Trichomonas vaginalis G3]|uniref:DegT/DnrJ/EryC1/StrS aminotransferase family protein n=1 Tax=Trichomonas vaginalis (strain ATCC PRA-98 / G3) TaxID=412133 RepID=A2FEU1_TRIV3|nr:DegT/DnrJ/EryC1/StrS aminotransferase family [Trichomonas vaginalis G3]EAX96588.1 DegT/DnrJ/EryC1/StrS aminotransferase family protein [Trichomonas vaginalis G3]KAI5485918.1 DegT/DnrJ/EryC1/StrS aminotransferase family [Trichomonas vaginalis G3]|eukprot:XP_001309518.1 DegT/DnrJ/EryC1/StrS aminotransferase family protein [Trichomonas vaginalis G3]